MFAPIGIGNLIGRYEASKPNAKTLLLGSHYDTVRNGGKYDGRLGILVPLVLIEHLNRTKQRLPFNIELLCFSEEEGVRFPIGYLGSQAVSGKFDPKNLDATDDNGIPLRKVLEDAGVDVGNLNSLARKADDLIGYVELHIEQGPSLLNADIPVAVVTGIAGAVRHRVSVEGEAGHAGTVAMQFRHDAACCGLRNDARDRKTLQRHAESCRYRRSVRRSKRRNERNSWPLRIFDRYSCCDRRDARRCRERRARRVRPDCETARREGERRRSLAHARSSAFAESSNAVDQISTAAWRDATFAAKRCGPRCRDDGVTYAKRNDVCPLWQRRRQPFAT